MLRPPTFPVGPEMSGAICDIISQHPGLSDDEVARRVGADPAHPFFQTDLAVAHVWLSGDSVPSSRVDRLEREQRNNIRLAIAIGTVAVVGTDLASLSAALPVIEIIERNGLSSEHLVLAIQLVRLMGAVADAGYIRAPIETVLRECLDADPNILSRNGEVGSEAVKKVLSGPPTKDATRRTIEVPVDPTEGGGRTIEGETEREHGGEFNARTGTQRQATKPPKGYEWRSSDRR